LNTHIRREFGAQRLIETLEPAGLAREVPERKLLLHKNHRMEQKCSIIPGIRHPALVIPRTVVHALAQGNARDDPLVPEGAVAVPEPALRTQDAKDTCAKKMRNMIMTYRYI
jgi:hypothetical protein